MKPSIHFVASSIPSVPPSCPVAEPICLRLRLRLHHAHLPAPVHAKTAVNIGVVWIYSCVLWIIIITYSIYIPQKKNIYAWYIVILMQKTFCLRKMVSPNCGVGFTVFLLGLV